MRLHCICLSHCICTEDENSGDDYVCPDFHGCSSTHISPSGVVSFFQIGVMRLSSSIHHLHALKASALWAAPTTIRTMFSPMLISLILWIILTSIMSKSLSAFSLISFNLFSAIPG